MNHELLASFTHDDTGGTPRKIVHLPERIQWKQEGEYWDREDVEHHPANHVPLPANDKDECLKTVDSRDHDKGQCRDRFAQTSGEVDEICDLWVWHEVMQQFESTRTGLHRQQLQVG